VTGSGTPRSPLQIFVQRHREGGAAAQDKVSVRHPHGKSTTPLKSLIF
jgi:hypothetical protein